jgi:hypothetical protein
MSYRYFYDTEFLENGSTIELISIGIVGEDGEAYYAVNFDAPWERIYQSKWLMDNVWPHLPVKGYTTQLSSVGAAATRVLMKDRGHLDTTDTRVRPAWVIANEVREFLRDGGDDIELWADYAAYDHVALMQLWGPMIRRPKHVPMFTHDIQQAARMLDIADQLPEQDGAEHHALADAQHVKTCYDVIASIVNGPDA